MKKCIFALIISVVFTTNLYAFDKKFSFTTLDYPPFISRELIKENKSWVLSVVKAALEPQGYEVMVAIKPWARAYHDTINGKHDGIYAAAWTKERLQWFEYSLPIGQISKGFFKRKDRKNIVFTGDIASLKNYSIAMGREFATTPAFDKAAFLNKYPVKDSLQGIKMLYAGRVDLVVASLEVDVFRFQQLETEFPGIRNAIIFMHPPLETQILYMAVSKKAPGYQEKLRDLNIGLSTIMLDGTFARIKKGYGVEK